VTRAAYRYLVAGRVQGVGYRYFALRQAEALRLGGFARNLPDGRVEVVAEGSEDALARYEERLREGPSFARVSSVEREAVPPRGSGGFDIR
jgi:acylphosphatase